MIMLICAIIAVILVAIDFLRPGNNLTALAVLSLAIGHIIEYLA